LTVVYRDDGARLGHWRNVAVFVWLNRITLPRIEGAHQVMDTLLARGDGSIFALSVIPVMRVSNLAMDDDVRRRHMELYQKVASRAVGNAVAVETPGFVAAFVRAVISSTLHLTRSPVPTRIFESRAHAAAWLVRQGRDGDPSISARTLLEKLGALTSDIKAR
jgi:hypothetical protein